MDKYIHTIIYKLTGWNAPVFLLIILVAAVMAAFISVTVMFLIWLERKVAGKFQNRMGPMFHGPRFLARITMWLGGLFQTAWDASKLLLKEQITPAKADKIVFWTAPVVVFTACIMAYVIIPFGPGVIVKDLNLGLLYLLAVTTFTVIAILMAGWSSNNKYSLLGGFRSAAQVISYEVPLIFSLLGVVIMAETLKMGQFVEAQKEGWFIIPQFVAFIVYIICATAELNRPPFDIPEAESELVSGYNIEYSGMGFAMFFLSEWANLFLVSAVAVTLFFGGWLLPFGLAMPSVINMGPLTVPYFNIIGSVIVFFIKVYLMIFLFMWIRWTFPRLRSDQLMDFGWKVLLPIAFLNIVATGIMVLL